MKVMTKDTMASVILLFVSVFAIYHIRDLSPTSSIFPVTVSLILLTLSVIYFLKSFRKKTETRIIVGKNSRKLAIGTVAYVCLIWLLGYFFASLLFMTGITLKLRAEKQQASTIKTLFIILTIVIFLTFVFSTIFQVPLPAGRLEEWIPFIFF